MLLSNMILMVSGPQIAIIVVVILLLFGGRKIPELMRGLGSGIKEKLEQTGRHNTQYSARHFAATDALMRGVDIYTLALNLGTSVTYIEKTSSHLSSMMRSQEITKGQGYYKALEERDKSDKE